MKKKSKLSIRILNWRDIKHPLAGGAEISLHEHAKFWIRNGAEVTWYSASWRDAKKKEVLDGILFIRLGNHLTVHILFFIHYILGRVKKADVSIDSFHFVPYFSPFYLRREKIVALINEVAGDLWYTNIVGPIAMIGEKIEPFFLKFYSKVPFITASESTKNELVHLGIKEGDIRIVHHGVTIIDPDPSVVKEKVPTILFLNRISEDKGIEDVLKVYIDLQKKINELQLWIVGKEERIGMMDSFLKKYGVRGGIHYMGYVSQEEKFKILRRAWVLIHPSKKEGWGLTVIEAASQGTPTVGYNVEGLRDSIQDNVTGFLVEPTRKGLFDGISRILSEKSQRIEMSKNCIKWSRQFSWDKAGGESWRILNEI